MYKIIGADGKEYGPIPAEVLRQWIAEGRANAQTKIQAEGTTEWKLLSDFPEFAPATPPPPPPAPIGLPAVGPGVRDQVVGPAIGLIVFAILGFLLQAAALVWRVGFAAMAASQMSGTWGNTPPPWAALFSGTLGIASSIIGLLVSGLILLAGIKMQRVQNYGLAMAGSIIAMIPCVSPCCLIGLPIGIWAVVILSRPDVKAAFQ